MMRRRAGSKASPLVSLARRRRARRARVISLFNLYAARRNRELDQEESDVVAALWRREPFADGGDAPRGLPA